MTNTETTAVWILSTHGQHALEKSLLEVTDSNPEAYYAEAESSMENDENPHVEVRASHSKTGLPCVVYLDAGSFSLAEYSEHFDV